MDQVSEKIRWVGNREFSRVATMPEGENIIAMENIGGRLFVATTMGAYEIAFVEGGPAEMWPIRIRSGGRP
jgi:hypothetical protein